ncbi:cuticle protein-like [Ischnura elegans]|uniref:cuticle protein-like n=1 Tax=Ischnura elegans TaxID=197161 RepID=UPI001ED88036|nr:cuticle protein-like [Ischnura elegans]
MKVLVCLAVAIACASAQLHVFPFPYAHTYVPFPYHAYSTFRVAPVPASTQYHAQDSFGQFSFGHAGDGQSRVEAKTIDGAVRGAYSYVDPTGKLINVHYQADGNGFRVLGANNLPVAPEVPAVPAVELPVGPEPVQDTPEVIAARADFEKKYAEAAEAAAAAPEEPTEVAVSRRRRDAVFPIVHAPLVHHVAAPLPAVKTTFKYKAFEPVDAAVPADTKKLEIAEKEHEVISYPYPYALVKALPVTEEKVEEVKPIEIKTAFPAFTPFGYYY